jgi:hypothetical protein
LKRNCSKAVWKMFAPSLEGIMLGASEEIVGRANSIGLGWVDETDERLLWCRDRFCRVKSQGSRIHLSEFSFSI